MKAKIQNKIIEVLDVYCDESSLRITPSLIINICRIQEQYFIRSKSLRKLYYYVREIGIVPTLLKVWSRTRERYRNKKWLSIGLGKADGKDYYFIATNHPACQERYVIDKSLTYLTERPEITANSHHIKHMVNAPQLSARLFNALQCVAGWQRDSGNDLKFGEWSSLIKVINDLTDSEFPLVDWQGGTSVQTRLTRQRISCQKKAALFGLGNYAKTMLLPNLHQDVVVTDIHEIDPLQCLPYRRLVSYDTQPFPHPDQHHDVYFIAGYHHTHAALAIEGLNKDCDVVVEKPIVTTESQLTALLDAMRKSTGRLYACFQKRFHIFNEYIRADLQGHQGQPISYHAVVYEEALPEKHWYRWPNSQSAIVSNGCHWIDHFFYLNNYAKPMFYDAKRYANGNIVLTIELENTAVMSLVLSHEGSARIGVQEYVELRCEDVTIRMTNSSIYHSENSYQVLRRKKVNKYDAYRKMYRQISEGIARGSMESRFESPAHLELVTHVILGLNRQVLEEQQEVSHSSI